MRLQVRGDATPEETAAVVVALSALAVPSAPERPRWQAWSRAARLEGLGQAPVSSSRDPRLAHPGAGRGEPL